MPELKWLDEYSGQTTEELISLDGKYRTDSIIVAFEQALNQKAARFGDESLSNEEILILAIEALETEVNNGGYDQFFRNSSKEYVSIIVDSLKRIGYDEIAALTQRAIDSLGDEDRENILGKCDEEYYAKAGDLAIPLFAFIKNNRDKINL